MTATTSNDPKTTELPRLCQDDNWAHVLDDPAPRAVRWAMRAMARQFNDPDWGRWHYTEGNGNFTACGSAVIPFQVDGSPQEGRLRKVTCRHCKAKMARFNVVDPDVA